MKSGLGLPLALSILTHLTVMLPLALFGKNTVLPERSLEVVLVHSIDNGRGSDAAVQKSETLRNFKARKDAHVKNKMPSSAKLHPVKERGLHHEGIVESDKSRKADMMSVHEVNADDDREGGQPISTRSSSVDLDIGAGNGSEGMGQDGEQYGKVGWKTAPSLSFRRYESLNIPGVQENWARKGQSFSSSRCLQTGGLWKSR